MNCIKHLGIVLIFAGLVSAQGLEVSFPKYNETNTTAFSGIYSGSFPFSAFGKRWAVDLAFSRFALDGGGIADNQIGNPALSLRTGHFIFKGWLPITGEDNAAAVMAYSFRLNANAESFAPGVLPFAASAFKAGSLGFVPLAYRFESGLVFWFPTENFISPDNFEMFLPAKLTFSESGEHVTVGLNLTSRWILSGALPSVDEGAYAQIEFFAKYGFGRFYAGAGVALPIGDNMSAILDRAVSLRVGVN